MNMRSSKKISWILLLGGALISLPPEKADATETNSVVITKAQTLTWNWVPEYFFSVGSAINGSTTGDTNGWYLAGTTNSVKATPESGHYFVEWSGADVPSGSETNNPLEIVLDGPKAGIVPIYLAVPRPCIVSFDGSSLSITNLVPTLDYVVQDCEDLSGEDWKDRVSFAATSAYEDIPVLVTNSPEFLRVQQAP